MRWTPLLAGSLAAILFGSCTAMTRAGAPSPQTRGARGLPEQFGERTLHSVPYAFVYARQPSAANQMEKVLGTAVKDARRDGVTEPGEGLILVMDTKDAPPIEITRLMEMVEQAGAQMDPAQASDSLRAAAGKKKELERVGADTSALLALAPIPIRPGELPKIAPKLPAGVERQIGWCLIIPTDNCVRAGMKKAVDAALKNEKVNFAERLSVRALMPLIERKAVQQVKKSAQAALYESLLHGRKDLREGQRLEMVKAYKQKLGLDDKARNL